MPLKTDLRSVPNWLRWPGAFFTFAGALGLIIGGILPWARFSLLGTQIGIPGAVQWGAVTLVIGLLVLYLTSLRRRLPLLVMILGVIAVCIGVWAQDETGKQVRRQLLALENRLAPVNARLAEVTLPPIEPFGPGLGRSQDYRGPGPLWTTLGGVSLAFGGTLSFVGGRLSRSCRRCGVAWRTGRIVLFCPSCGISTGRTDTCVQCRAMLERGDIYCASCGTPTATVS